MYFTKVCCIWCTSLVQCWVLILFLQKILFSWFTTLFLCQFYVQMIKERLENIPIFCTDPIFVSFLYQYPVYHSITIHFTYHLHQFWYQLGDSLAHPPLKFLLASRFCSWSTSWADRSQSLLLLDSWSQWWWLHCLTGFWAHRIFCSSLWCHFACSQAVAPTPPSVSWMTQGRHWPWLEGLQVLEWGETK